MNINKSYIFGVIMSKDKNLAAKVPGITRDNPVAASTISKLNTDKENSKLNPDFSNFPNISISTKDRLKNNENIIQLFPDVELSMQILVSSILSPNDLLTVSVNYANNDIKLPADVKASLREIIKKYIETNYNIEDKLGTMIKEALFTKGAYVEAVIPEAIVDDIINADMKNKEGEISIESFLKDSLPTGSEYNFLGDLSTDQSKKNEFTLSQESLALDMGFEASKAKSSIQVKPSDLNIDITDNPAILSVADRYLEVARESNISKMFNSTSNIISVEENEYDLESIFKSNKDFKKEEFIHVSNKGSRNSVGKPMITKFPVESVIPVHSSNDVSKHIGYFILLDNTGRPVDSTSELKTSEDQIRDMLNVNDSKLNIIKKAKDALQGITKKDVKLENLETLYSNIVESMIKDKLKNGMFGELVDIKDNADIYRVMMIRALKAKQTRLLFLPVELVSYFAFEYRDNGTGKSLLEKNAMLFSIRSILLFTGIMAEVKNSTSVTNVSATLDENDPDPEGTMQKIVSESLKTRQTQLPLGYTAIDDMVNWAHKVGFKYSFTGGNLPEMTISSSEETASKTTVSNELIEKIEEQIIMSFGLTPEIVKSGYETDFATSVVAKNLLLAKRVMQLQNIFTPMLEEHIKRIIKADAVLMDKLAQIVESNVKDIKKSLNKNKNNEVATYLNSVPAKDFNQHLLKMFIEDLTIGLPSPELQEADAMNQAFQYRKEMVDEYVDLLISEDAIPEELAGELAYKTEGIAKVLKVMLLKKWMSDNDFMPELNEFMVLDDDGKPVADMVDEYQNYLDSLGQILLPFLKEGKRKKTKLDKKIAKVDDEEEEETPPPTTTEPTSSETPTENTGDVEETPLEDNFGKEPDDNGEGDITDVEEPTPDDEIPTEV
jgi:hypothetical protein